MTESEERVITLGKEGMPATWIAEDVGLCATTVRKILRGAGVKAEQKEWLRAWSFIKASEEVLALHRECAPQAVRR